MIRKTTFAFILAAVLLLAISTIALAGDQGTAAAQDTPATATPEPLVTPIPAAGMYIDGTSAMNCPMMSGMQGMGTMQGTSGTNMNNMGSMGSMMMPGMNLPGMSNMPMSDNYVILSDPATWFNINPWILIGWIVLALVVLALLAALGLGVFYFARRIALTRPAPKA